MNLHIALYELMARHRLSGERAQRLWQLAGLREEPPALKAWLPRGLAILGAALGGFGIILWIAANWDTLGRFARFALLQGAVLVMCVGAQMRPAARAPLALLAFIGIGGLFAYFGQTYQTGADAWQLFALWAALALPLCLGTRSDVLWTPWVLVAMVAISLWAHAHAGYRWTIAAGAMSVHALAWGGALSLVAALRLIPRRITGAGDWSLRAAVTLAVVLVSFGAMAALFQRVVAPQYMLGLAMMAGASVLLAQRRVFDVYALSATVLGLNALLVSGLAWLLLDVMKKAIIAPLLFIGIAAAALLAASVNIIMRMAKHYREQGEPA